jgi:hypothetical protein
VCHPFRLVLWEMPVAMSFRIRLGAIALSAATLLAGGAPAVAGPAATVPAPLAVPAADTTTTWMVAVPAGYDLQAPADAADRVTFGEPGSLHGVRLAPVTVRPAADKAAAAPVSLAFVPAATAGKSAAATDARPLPESIATLIGQTALGFDKSAYTTIPRGTWVCLSPPGTQIQNALAPLFEWRRRQGYNVVAATTTDVGGNDAYAIKAWLQNLYDTLPVPMEMVCLVGDANGSVPVDTWQESLSGLYGEGDHFYTQLDGSDILGDVHLGRLSVTSVSGLTTVVGKIVAYEDDPWLTDDQTWFTRACLVADVSESGWSTIYSSRWIKEHLLRLNYTTVDTIFGGNYLAQQLASLNAGRSLYTYRGHWQMSGLTTPFIQTLTNGRKLPFVTALTCGTGSFQTDTTCQTEAFLRNANGGAIAAIGTATTGTHTRFNDCIFQGIIDHVLLSGDPRLGPALSRGKLHLFDNYQAANPDTVAIWSTWNNLMGDPATPLWTAIPSTLTVSAPAAIDAAADAVAVSVTTGGLPVAGAIVSLRGTGDPLATGVTAADGRVVLPLAGVTGSSLQLTVTGPNLKPWLGTLAVGTQPLALRPLAFTIDDNATGSSVGDGDGVAEPGETIELSIPLRNDGTQAASSVQATLDTVPVSGVLRLHAQSSYPNIGAGLSVSPTNPLVVRLAPSVTGGISVPLPLSITTASGTFAGVAELAVAGPAAKLGTVTSNGSTAPGGSATLTLSLTNSGNRATTGLTLTLTSRDRWVSVTDGSATLPAAAVGATVSTTTGALAVAVAAGCPAGHLAVLDLNVAFAGGGTAVLEVPLTCGQAAADDPCGPDAHGYYAFDDLDIGYAQAPVYNWVEIDPGLGGPGTSLGLTDYALYGDQSAQVTLPFTFRYYGHDFTRITVCSNGWLSFGATPVLYYRNWRTPTPGAADNMVCAFWDDLLQSPTEGGVFWWYDAAQHRVIVEWSRLRNEVDGTSLETFEVILKDPAQAAGETGDGDVVIQYQTVNQVDDLNGYSTVGIQNGPRDDGVLYSYWNQAAPGGAPLVTGRAIRFTTLVNVPGGPADSPLPPAVATLAQNRPNPFNPRTSIAFTLAAPGAADLAVYDLEGRLVRRLAAGTFAAGAHTVTWQGDDEQGLAVASGTYFYRLRTDDGVLTRKLTLLR